jgi:hypothetical protein
MFDNYEQEFQNIAQTINTKITQLPNTTGGARGASGARALLASAPAARLRSARSRAPVCVRAASLRRLEQMTR